MKTNKLKESKLSHDTLKNALKYNPTSGIFTWKRSPTNSVRSGVKAGSLNKYIFIRINGFSYSAHRLAWFYMFECWPKNQIDHIDRVKTNNKICNLREATMSENHRNMKINPRNSSGFCGVFWDKQRKRYLAYITLNGKMKNLGRFKNLSTAAKVRRDAELRYGFSGA